jgi:hypothetical protein
VHLARSAFSRALPVLTAGLALAGCAPKLHTVEPYRSDPAAAAALEARAAERCAARTAPPAPDEGFVTDGCSVWFDGSWVECCIEHDATYWCGGPRPERAESDRDLRACVDQTAPTGLAWLTWLGTRIGGHPLFPLHYRWGFGRSYCPWYVDEKDGD